MEFSGGWLIRGGTCERYCRCLEHDAIIADGSKGKVKTILILNEISQE